MLLKDFNRPFDWTYTSDYKGTVRDWVKVEPADVGIDYEQLKRQDPILFYSSLTLYEDELADNGCAQVYKCNFLARDRVYTFIKMCVRIRVMPTCFFILCRFYLRVDHGNNSLRTFAHIAPKIY